MKPLATDDHLRPHAVLQFIVYFAAVAVVFVIGIRYLQGKYGTAQLRSMLAVKIAGVVCLLLAAFLDGVNAAHVLPRFDVVWWVGAFVLTMLGMVFMVRGSDKGKDKQNDHDEELHP